MPTDKPFEAERCAECSHSRDGRKIAATLEGANGELLDFTLPTRQATVFIRLLHEQTQRALDRAQASHQGQHGGLVQLVAHQPKTLRATEDAATGDLVMIFDEGKASELVIQLPRLAVASVAQQLLPFLREEPPASH